MNSSAGDASPDSQQPDTSAGVCPFSYPSFTRTQMLGSRIGRYPDGTEIANFMWRIVWWLPSNGDYLQLEFELDCNVANCAWICQFQMSAATHQGQQLRLQVEYENSRTHFWSSDIIEAFGFRSGLTADKWIYRLPAEVLQPLLVRSNDFIDKLNHPILLVAWMYFCLPQKKGPQHSPT